jgi:hypothetical protein
MPKEMNRTSGAARRKISKAEEVRYAMKTGKPLTGSASGVKSITPKQAGEVLTQGIVSLRGNKFSVDPVGLAMAVSPFKILGGVARKSAAGLKRLGGYPADFIEEEKAALDAAGKFMLAAKFPKSAGAKGMESSIVKEVLKVKGTGDPNSSGIMNAVRLGGETLWTTGMDEKAKKQAFRAVAKVIGKAGRSEPSLRGIGKELRKIGKRKY